MEPDERAHRRDAASEAAGGEPDTMQRSFPPGVVPRGRLLVRLSGDLTTKARFTRTRFVRKLQLALKDALRSEGFGSRVVRTRDRVVAEIDDPSSEAADRAARALARVFGVQSVAVAEPIELPSDPRAATQRIIEAGHAFYRERVRGKRFAVRARRVGNRERIPIDSRVVERELGTLLLPESAGVDLANPEVCCTIEIVNGLASLTRAELPGPGGLPLGVEGSAVGLISGGFDSAVAAWMIMRRGVSVDFVFCNLGGDEHLLGTLAVAKHLADQHAYGDRPRFHAIDFEPLANAIQRHCEMRMWQVVLKRLFLRAAELVASERNGQAIVTGDAIGQVSSQTLVNIAAISDAASLPVFRPLVGSNKEEILQMARQIGTYEASNRVGEYCALVPGKPATAASRARARAQEARVLEAEPDLLPRLVAERTLIDLRSVDLESRRDDSIRTDALDEGDVLIDLRAKAAFQNWHHPDALNLDFSEAMAAYPHFDPKQRYVLVCDIGLKSAQLAQRMREHGLDAAHFVGGHRALVRLARARGLPTP